MKLKFRNFVLDIQLKRYIFTEGIDSRTEDDKHVLFLDFDYSNISAVEATCRILQNGYGCGSFYIFQTSPGKYHAICPDKFNLKEIVMLQLISGNDRNHTAKGLEVGGWLLRFGTKGNAPPPEFVKFLYAPSFRQRSFPHLKWISLYYKNSSVEFLEKHLENIDNKTKLGVVRYGTFERA
jgi:hypothetical protein